MDTFLGVIVCLTVGFVVGSMAMLESWEKSAKRGHFELGGVIYKVEPMKP